MASEPLLGTIFMFAGNFAPTGYLACQGQLLSISSNAALFAILGTTCGGNGTTNFALPDLQGRAPIGVGNGAGLSPVVEGQKAGVASVTIQTANMPAHNHLINVNAGNGNQPMAPGNFIAGAVDSSPAQLSLFNSAATAGNTLAPSAVTSAGGSVPLNIQNPYLGVFYIIATVGIFPSRS